jgi:hypothetical protein
MTQSARKPQAYAMLLCQRVIKEEETGLISLISIFEAVTADRLPLTIPSLFVFAKLTDAQGEYVFKLEVVRRNDEKLIAEAPLIPVTVEDPMAIGELILELGGLTFTEAGHYDFRLWANEQFITSKSMLVAVVESMQEGEHGPAED